MLSIVENLTVLRVEWDFFFYFLKCLKTFFNFTITQTISQNNKRLIFLGNLVRVVILECMIQPASLLYVKLILYE